VGDGEVTLAGRQDSEEAGGFEAQVERREGGD